jgi:hypothetical protein
MLHRSDLTESAATRAELPGWYPVTKNGGFPDAI